MSTIINNENGKLLAQISFSDGSYTYKGINFSLEVCHETVQHFGIAGSFENQEIMFSHDHRFPDIFKLDGVIGVKFLKIETKTLKDMVRFENKSFYQGLKMA